MRVNGRVSGGLDRISFFGFVSECPDRRIVKQHSGKMKREFRVSHHDDCFVRDVCGDYVFVLILFLAEKPKVDDENHEVESKWKRSVAPGGKDVLLCYSVTSPHFPPVFEYQKFCFPKKIFPSQVDLKKFHLILGIPY